MNSKSGLASCLLTPCFGGGMGRKHERRVDGATRWSPASGECSHPPSSEDMPLSPPSSLIPQGQANLVPSPSTCPGVQSTNWCPSDSSRDLLHSLEVGPHNLPHDGAESSALFHQGPALLLITAPGAHRNGKEWVWQPAFPWVGGGGLIHYGPR